MMSTDSESVPPWYRKPLLIFLGVTQKYDIERLTGPICYRDDRRIYRDDLRILQREDWLMVNSGLPHCWIQLENRQRWNSRGNTWSIITTKEWRKTCHIAFYAYRNNYMIMMFIWQNWLYDRIVYITEFFFYNRDCYITEMNIWQRCSIC